MLLIVGEDDQNCPASESADDVSRGTSVVSLSIFCVVMTYFMPFLLRNINRSACPEFFPPHYTILMFCIFLTGFKHKLTKSDFVF